MTTCPYLGPPTAQKRPALHIKDRIVLDVVHECRLYQRCTMNLQVADYPCCLGCPNDPRFQAARHGKPIPKVEPPKPGIFQQAASLTSAVVKHVAAGLPTISDEEYAKRRAACDACPHRDASNDSCKLCGCYLSGKLFNKLKLPGEQCPDKPPRWTAV